MDLKSRQQGITELIMSHRCSKLIKVRGKREPVNGINACIIQELTTHSGHIRLGIVLHQEEPRAHSTSVRSDDHSEDFIPVPNSCKGTVGYDMEVRVTLQTVVLLLG